MPHEHHHPAPSVHADVFVTADELAARYRVSTRFILKLAAEKRIPSIRLGNRRAVRFDLEAVAAALESAD